MAGSFADFLELELLDHVFGAAAYTAPATLYIALYTVAPDDTGGGTEVTGGSYARLAVTNNATNFPAAAAGAKSNGVVFTFVTATANWGTVVAYGIFDAVTAGNLLAWADLTVSKAVNSGDTASFPVGDLDITLG